MSLFVFERTLLNLYSNSAALTSFLADPTAYTKALDLSSEEKEALRGIPHLKFVAFQNQLHRKSFKIAKATLRTRNTVILMSLHPLAPVLLYGSSEKPQTIPLTTGSYQLIHRLARLKLPLSPSAILAEYAQSPLSSLRDVAFLIRTAITHRFLGAHIKIPLVL